MENGTKFLMFWHQILQHLDSGYLNLQIGCEEGKVWCSMCHSWKGGKRGVHETVTSGSCDIAVAIETPADG